MVAGSPLRLTGSSGHQRSRHRGEVSLVNLFFHGLIDNAVPKAGAAQGMGLRCDSRNFGVVQVEEKRTARI